MIFCLSAFSEGSWECWFVMFNVQTHCPLLSCSAVLVLKQCNKTIWGFKAEGFVRIQPPFWCCWLKNVAAKLSFGDS